MSFSASIPPFSHAIPSTEDYARIPDVKQIKGLFQKHQTFVQQVQQVFRKHKADKDFVLFAFHKHFDVPEGHVLFLESAKLPKGDLGEVVRPVPIKTLGKDIHAIAWFVDGEVLKPYKFSPGAGPELLQHSDCARAFVKLVNQAGLSGSFAIKLPNVSPNVPMGEVEFPEYGATYLVPTYYLDEMDGVVTGAQASQPLDDECASGETHNLTTRGTHFVMINKARGLPIADSAFLVLDSAPGTSLAVF